MGVQYLCEKGSVIVVLGVVAIIQQRYHNVILLQKVVLMVSNQMLTVRIPEEDLEKLDQLAAVRGRSRSQLVQEALAELISKNQNSRDLEFVRLRKRLIPAIVEQCKLLDVSVSFADDNRTF